MSDATPFRYRFRVRYAECDAQNVVFNGRYADFFDQACTELWRAMGLPYQALLERGLDQQVVKLTLELRAPARFDDVLEARVTCPRIGTTSYGLRIRFVRGEVLLVEAEAVYVMLDRATWTKTPLPDDLRARLDRCAAGALVDHTGGP